MTRSKRPKLGEILRGGEQPVAPPISSDATQQERREAEAPQDAEQAVEKMVQLNVMVPAQLRRDVRIKALQEGVEVSTVVRELLKNWLKRGGV